MQDQINRYNQATNMPVAGQNPANPGISNPVNVPPQPYGRDIQQTFLPMLPGNAPVAGMAMGNPQGYAQQQQQQQQSIAEDFQGVLQGIGELGLKYPQVQNILLEAGQKIVIAMGQVGSDQSTQGIPASLR